MGQYVSNISYTLDWAVGGDEPTINVNKGRGDPALHVPVVCGSDSDADWSLYLGTLTAAKTSKAAFVAAMTSAWGSGVASQIAGFSTAEQDALVKVAARLAVRHGV